MPEGRPLPLWAGRTAALLGSVLVALTLRQAVAGISPILADIRVDVPISTVGVGLLGTLPPILFAVSGFIAPRVARGIGLDSGIVLALLLMTAGHLVRAFAPAFAVLLVGSIVAFAGTGIGKRAAAVCRPALLPRPGRPADRGVRLHRRREHRRARRPRRADRRAGRLAVLARHLGGHLGRRARPVARRDRARTPPAVRGCRRRVPASRTCRPRHTVVAVARGGVDHHRLLDQHDLHLRGAWLPEILGDVAGSTPTEAGALLAVTG